MRTTVVICEPEITPAFMAAGFRPAGTLKDGRVQLVFPGLSPDRAEAVAAKITSDLFCIRTDKLPHALLECVESMRLATATVVSEEASDGSRNGTRPNCPEASD